MKKKKYILHMFLTLGLFSCASMNLSGNSTSQYQDSIVSTGETSMENSKDSLDSSSMSSTSMVTDEFSSSNSSSSEISSSTKSSDGSKVSSKDSTSSSRNTSDTSGLSSSHNSSTSHNSSDSSMNSTESLTPPAEDETDLYHQKKDYSNLSFANMFQGKWNRPGLYNEDGSIHKMPIPVKQTGKKIDVTSSSYGAIANNPDKDNYKAFKKAIEAAKSGDTIYIPKGKYYFKNSLNKYGFYSQISILKDNITLQGESKEETILISNFEENYNQSKNTTLIGILNAHQVAIKDVTISSVVTDDLLPDIDDSKANPKTYLAPRYGIVVSTNKEATKASEQTKNVLIENCIIEKFLRSGVRIDCAQETIVSSCTVQKATGLGGGGAGYGIDIQGYKNNYNDLVDGKGYLDTCFNVVTECQFVGPYIRHGALIQYHAHNNLIHKNTFKGTLLDSIDMHGEDEYSNEICHNDIDNSRNGACIGLGNTGGGDEGAAIGGNRHDASGRNHFIHDNVLKNSKRAIDIMLDTPNTFIYNNIIDNIQTTGIKITSSQGIYILQNQISNIMKNETILIDYDEIKSYTLKNYDISENTFTNCKTGIYSQQNITGITVKNNKFTNVTTPVGGTIPQNQIGETTLPESDDFLNPVFGKEVLPIDNSYIEYKSLDTVVTLNSTLKLRSGNARSDANRIPYLLWNKSNMPSNYQKVYLSFTIKVQNATPTINIFTNTTYTSWSGSTLTWNNSKLHQSEFATIKNTSDDPINSLIDFTIPEGYGDYSFHTFYINVTEAFQKIPNSLFTMIITNEAKENVYMEIQNLKSENSMKFIFVN